MAECDLILLSWNHLEQTRPCLDSLFQHTSVPCRLLIVDNGSEPDVRSFLASVKPHGVIEEVILLQNETNEGFPKGMNRGIRAATAPFVCLLNNDLLFTPGWLEELIAVARQAPHIGVINPTSSTFGNAPPHGMSLEQYAAQLRRWHGQFTEVGMCIGFCVLVKREVIERVGELDEQVERVFFEDEDFCMRTQEAGYQCVVADASYVYHREHQSVKEVPERHALFARNRRWCEKRWGRRIRIAWPWFQEVSSGSPDTRAWLEELLRWVRRRTHVYVYCPLSSGMTGDVLFRAVGLVPHADIHWQRTPRRWSRWVALWRILLRQKKRFDIIVSPDPTWGRVARWFRWLHRAVVIPVEDSEELMKQWQATSRSLS